MWPHSIVVQVGRTVIAVGTDDDELVAFLEPWKTDAARNLIDLGLQLHPAQPADRSAPRRIANLRHGSDYLASVDDPDLLRSCLLRILGSFEHPVPEGCFRVSGMVVEHGGIGYVVPVGNIKISAHRSLLRLGFRPHYALSALIDAGRHEVVLDLPLGSVESSGDRLPLGGIWLAHRSPEDDATVGEWVARLMGNVVPDSSAYVEGRARRVLDAACELVGHHSVHVVGPSREALEKQLTALIGR